MSTASRASPTAAGTIRKRTVIRPTPERTGFDPAAAGWEPYPQAGFVDHVGPFWRRADRFGFRAEPHHANPGGVVHGGMMVTFADHTLGVVVWDAIGRVPCATVSLNCDFHGATRPGDWVEGRAWLTRKGQSLVFVQGEFSVDGRPVLGADGIWKIIGKD